MSEDEADDLFDVACNGTDLDWYKATGDCGGCGSGDCHDGSCTTGDTCAKCPERRMQGWPV
jgi:hypothetical protein